MADQTQLQAHRQLTDALLNPACYSPPVETVERIETHISTVLLAGDYVFKLKKPVNLGFLDFTPLQQRKHSCEEEIRLNSRLAPQLYLGVSRITGTRQAPSIDGDGDAFEYAVRMRRFPQSQRMDNLLEQDLLSPEQIDSLADTIAAFHQSPETGGPPPAPMNTVPGLQQPVLENLAQLRDLPSSKGSRPQIERIAHWTQSQAAQLNPLLQHRLAEGFVRECHGDLHTKNITCLDGTLVPYDGIEFSEQLRWIDGISELAFLCMDLTFRGRMDFSARLLSRYLDATGDHAGVQLLRYYQIYRAMVRAKVQALHLEENKTDEPEFCRIAQERDAYLALAEQYTVPLTPTLTITCGLSASGKSTQAMALIERSGAIRLRSDVERKRLHGLAASATTGAALNQGIYSNAASDATYRHLTAVAKTLLSAGWPVVVDAACLQRKQRDAFRRLAESLKLPFRILYCDLPLEKLQQRMRQRAMAGNDPSEANNAHVLHSQLNRFQPPEHDEQPFIIYPDTNASVSGT